MFGRYRSSSLLVVTAAAYCLLLSAVLFVKTTTAFVVVTTPTSRGHCTGAISMMAGGFGSGSSNKKKEVKLKPKAQWDRYLALKKETPFGVAVRKSSGENWLEVGKVKSKDNANTITAVARQRALIADHARRLFPLQISQKDRVEWAYLGDDGDWVIVDKNASLENAPDNIEKQIGFEGKPDPATGFYCYYNEGRLVNSSDEQAPALSKKLK